MIRILTDSASDILPAEAEQLGVTVIPLNVTLEDGVVLRDGIDMTPSAYYDHLASCRKLPTTSQPSPELFEKFYLEAAAAGDEVLGIFLSHELSGTWQCAKLAADLLLRRLCVLCGRLPQSSPPHSLMLPPQPTLQQLRPSSLPKRPKPPNLPPLPMTTRRLTAARISGQRTKASSSWTLRPRLLLILSRTSRTTMLFRASSSASKATP